MTAKQARSNLPVLLVLHAHVVVVVDSLCPCESVEDLAKLVIANYVHFPVYEGEVPQQCGDQVYLYATELLFITLLWHGFHDATCEGDGDRLLLYWKFFLVVLKSSSRWKYAKEAVNILISRSLFSERKAHQLTWSQTVNMKGRIGCNIPCDLNQEHLIRRLNHVKVNGQNETKDQYQSWKVCVNCPQNLPGN